MKMNLTQAVISLVLITIIIAGLTPISVLQEDTVGVVKGTLLIDKLGYVHVNLVTEPDYSRNETICI
ncbi:MAG: hypothetical protein NDF55_08895 [archaeon GB-1867-005]|nr:hypothetical protein [Candidatus Culexmicrobium cathedralense]